MVRKYICQWIKTVKILIKPNYFGPDNNNSYGIII